MTATLPEPDEHGVVRIRFDAREHPCNPAADWYPSAVFADHIAWHIGPEDSSYVRLLRELSDGLPGGMDMNATHRYLIAQNKRADMWPVRRVIQTALETVRKHSTLYGGRSCKCRAGHWAKFGDLVAALLDTSPAATERLWSARSGKGGYYPDVEYKLHPTYLIGYGELYSSWKELPTREWTDVNMTIERDATGRIVVKTGRTPTRIFTPVTGERAQVARALRRAPYARGAFASWVLEWPDEAVKFALAWQGDDIRETMVALFDRGFSGWDQERRIITASLAAGWAGTLDDLISTAATVAKS